MKVASVLKMETIGFHFDLSDYKLSKIDILRELVTEKMTTAVRGILAVVETTVVGSSDSEIQTLCGAVSDKITTAVQEILAVVETTVMGYENEVSLLKRELDCHKKQMEAFLQPQVSLYRTDLEADRNQDPSDPVATNKNKDEESLENRLEHKDHPTPGHESTWENEVDSVPSNMSNVKKRRVIKLQIGVLKSSDSELSDNAFRPAPVRTVECPQNLSESDFLKELRSAFPEITENKPFEAFLSDSTKRSPLLVNSMTPTDLFKAFRSSRKRQFDFYIQLKDHEDTCNTLTNTTTSHDDNKPSTSSSGSAVEQPPETGEGDGMSSADSATSEEDEEDQDKSRNWKPEQNEKLSGAFKSGKSCFKKKKKSQKRPSNASNNCCKVCGTSFKSRAVLTKHAVSHVDDAEGLCGVCGEHFPSSEELRCHLDSHQKLYQCVTCGRFFSCKSGLQKHFNIHGTEKPFKCQNCPQSFVCEDDLKSHELNHKDKPYKCDTCPKAFWHKDQLDVHNRKHTGEKSFCCDVCGKLLSDFRSLCRHKQIHTGEKNYSCNYCGKRFLFLANQKLHETIHTAREKSFVCEICSKSFYTMAKLKCHQQIHEDKHIVKCTVCNKLLKRNLGAHMMIHTGEKPFSCSECGRKFRTKTIRDKHKTIHQKETQEDHTTIKPFSCEICGISSKRNRNIKIHMRIHTGEKPYSCTVCDRAFTQKSTLKTHMKTHQKQNPQVDLALFTSSNAPISQGSNTK